MTRYVFGMGIAGLLVGAGAVLADDYEQVKDDDVGDAVIRRTDLGNDGPVSPDAVLPDIVEVRLGAWEPFDPSNDPYTGILVDPEEAHIFRLVLVLEGLVNPPGRLGFAGDYTPFEFGPSPVYAIVELDVDHDKDTGGELTPIAFSRYLANAARFGGRPEGSYGERAILAPDDKDEDFFSAPQFERSGADFGLVLCGCWPITIVSEDGDEPGVFNEGETWVVRGRFLERAQGYQEASSVFGGSDFGLYDPCADVQFKHDMIENRTTITYVGALDMEGAAMLTGEQEQGWDFNVGNHTSIREALEDLIENAEGNWSDPVKKLIERWEGRQASDFLDPTSWDFSALAATTYVVEQDDASSPFVWTDAGFECESGDFNGDSVVDALDDDLFCVTNGDEPFEIPGFAQRFSMFDLNYDGVVDDADHACGCVADFNGDGSLNILDFVAFQSAFQAQDPSADVNGDGMLNILDFVTFQQLFVGGC